MPSINKFAFTTPADITDEANAAAYRLGLTGAAEFFRIAARHLIENKPMPVEFHGRRSIMKGHREFTESGPAGAS